MYLVVSYWKAKPGKEAEFEKLGSQVATMLRGQPGVKLVEEFKSGDHYVAVHGYESEKTYHKLINDPASEFNRMNDKLNVEAVGEWIRSERGETMPH